MSTPPRDPHPGPQLTGAAPRGWGMLPGVRRIPVRSPLCRANPASKVPLVLLASVVLPAPWAPPAWLAPLAKLDVR